MGAFGRIKMVTLDVHNTILKMTYPLGETYVKKTFETSGIKLETDVVNKEFYTEWKYMNKHYPHFGATTKPDWSDGGWWEQLCSRTLLAAGFPKDQSSRLTDSAQAIHKYYVTPDAWTILSNADEALSELAKTGVKIAVISNFGKRLHNLFDIFNLRQYIDHLIISEEAKSSKPEQSIFEQALLKAGLHNEPESVLHIGDHIRNDYYGAKTVGMRALLFMDPGTPHWPVGNEGPIDKADVVTSLKAVVDFVKKNNELYDCESQQNR
ncbi:unnamed protein product [Owenia fusiformis]|uniref:Uncharacterized protein n=1 Tax=Owenia fusiformis TaxID=6347 RepID=A0A8J1XWH9_OWEFU|nr:unnamed protein product [Owenia fusiformis]